MLEELRKELAEVNLDDPEVVRIMSNRPKIEPGEVYEFIDQIDEELIRLRILVIQLSNRIERMKLKYASDGLNPDTPDLTKDDHVRFLTELEPLEARLRDLNGLFWSTLKLDYSLSGAKPIVLTHDWRIFQMKPEPELPDMGTKLEIHNVCGHDNINELLSILGIKQIGHDHGGCSGCNCH